ncbi:2404_t:CDS:2 [Funneliformis mosseae]|uniref:2404_t:CDS:1 n=1 Tax=Funneliformis mosseae TaxID=27381 RepID=A0A9N9EBR3_FUNMO|nr:2404_t:CDS:2 [Funneliformis mosseae]
MANDKASSSILNPTPYVSSDNEKDITIQDYKDIENHEETDLDSQQNQIDYEETNIDL